MELYSGLFLASATLIAGKGGRERGSLSKREATLRVTAAAAAAAFSPSAGWDAPRKKREEEHETARKRQCATAEEKRNGSFFPLIGEKGLGSLIFSFYLPFFFVRNRSLFLHSHPSARLPRHRRKKNRRRIMTGWKRELLHFFFFGVEKSSRGEKGEREREREKSRKLNRLPFVVVAE